MSNVITRQPFFINSHYWIVAGDQTRVYSSAFAKYIILPDPKYDQWLALGFLPTQIDTEENLWDVLQQAAPSALSGLNLPIKLTAYNRLLLINKLTSSIADSLISGLIPNDPVIKDVALKLQPDIDAAKPKIQVPI